MNLIPWQKMVRHLARSHGFLDPFALLARLQQFAQPSEVHHPIELLRAGAAMHARGLLNARIIQHNLDWVWPFWVQRQFDPHDVAFVPRAFSLTHINLTHRNWTAVGLPDIAAYPIVDPAGLVTLSWDGWSIDAWVGSDDGRWLLPPRNGIVEQSVQLDDGLVVRTTSRDGGLALTANVDVVADGDRVECRIRYTASAPGGGWLVIALRPFNPEGVALVNDIELSANDRLWTVNEETTVDLMTAPDRHCVSHYRAGDVFLDLRDAPDASTVHCDLGMASAAACYRIEAGVPRHIELRSRLDTPAAAEGTRSTWSGSLQGSCEFKLPDARYQALCDIARHTLVLLSPDLVYPGPYTYKRFWFRDAAFMIDALLAMNFTSRAGRALSHYAERQNARGYFHSQDGEWDSNGEALWAIWRYCECTGTQPGADWVRMARRGADWILAKRLPLTPDSPHAGLMPPGFSAEHLGPNDYYYWDDFWSVAGLRAAASICRRGGDDATAARYARAADDFLACIETSLSTCESRLKRPAMPAAPYRRLDAGAIGSVVAGYPPTDRRLQDSVDYLLTQCRVNKGFFQDMIHSGINAYLSLHLAQILLRAGDLRYVELMDAVADLATATGQWPEAIHPATGGGCMGDGQHGWAAAEWLLLLRNVVVREEDDALVLASGVPAAWLESGTPIAVGPTATRFGAITVEVAGDIVHPVVSWRCEAQTAPPIVRIAMPGYASVTCPASAGTAKLHRR